MEVLDQHEPDRTDFTTTRVKVAKQLDSTCGPVVRDARSLLLCIWCIDRLVDR